MLVCSLGVARTITVVKMGAPFLGDFYVIFFIDGFLAALYSPGHELRFALDNSPFRSLCGRDFLCRRSFCPSSRVDLTPPVTPLGRAAGLSGGDRNSTRLNSPHSQTSDARLCSIN